MSDYSNISSIKLELQFVDPDGMVKPSFKEREFRPSNLLKLKFECPRVSCIDGGFDITNQVEASIRNNEPTIQLSSTCQGWQDSRRINKNRCLRKMICDVEIN